MEGALLVSVGLPDITNNVVIDAVENVVKIIAGVGRLFGDDEPKHLPEAPPYPGTVAGVPPYPGMPPATPPPPPPGGGGGLDTGATGAGDQYNGSVEAAHLTDEKLAEMLKQIFAANQGARDKVSAILTEIQNKQKQIGPEMGDPASVAAFGQFLDQKFAEIPPRSKRSSPMRRATPRRRRPSWMRSAMSTATTARMPPAAATTPAATDPVGVAMRPVAVATRRRAVAPMWRAAAQRPRIRPPGRSR